MTGPVTTDNLVQGAVKWLLTFTDVLAVLGTNPAGKHFLFQSTMWTNLEGTGTTAAVIGRAGGWTSPNTHNTMRFPRLSLEMWADPIRDSGGNEINRGEAERRIDAAFLTLDTHLHRPQGGATWWGTVRTVGCTRLGEPTVYPVPDGGGLQRLLAFYGVTQG